jgi:hypothetical protein
VARKPKKKPVAKPRPASDRHEATIDEFEREGMGMASKE